MTLQRPERGADRDVDPGPGAWLAAGAVALLLSLGLALLLTAVDRASAGRPPEAVAVRVVAVAMLAALMLGVVAALAARPWRSPATVAVALVGAVAVALAGTYLYVVGDAVRFRADILLWSEGEYVSDILKTRLGRPIYGPPADFSSFAYTPGSQLLTGALARLVGRPDSIPAYRAFQLVYVAIGSLAALLAFRRLVTARATGPAPAPAWVMAAAAAPALFLVATNTLTNEFNHLLHNDALAVCITAIAYWLLVEYAVTGARWAAWGMVLVPVAGYLVKQSLAIWAPLYAGYFVVFDHRLGWPRTLLAIGLAFGLVGLALVAGPHLWGKDFTYWTVTLMGNHPVSPMRSIQHLLEVWAYPAGLCIGGLLVLPSDRVDRLTGAWLVAAGLFAVEGYTSGIAWMKNHMGPGSLLAGTWFLAGLVALAARAEPRADRFAWARAAVATALVVLAFGGLGMVRIPAPWLAADTDRYAREIEREFAGMAPERVLLDYGTWTYLGARVVPKDRAAPIGEAGYTRTADFTGLLARIRSRAYDRILLRGYGTGDFAYDHEIWPASSGVRAALEANYREVRRIEAVQMRRLSPWFKTISVLEPRPDGPAEP